MANKTLKQLADELGVDKQKLYRFVKKNHINEVHQEAHQSTSVMQYDEAAQKLIKQAFSQKEVHQEVHQNHINDAVVDVLLKQSELLKKELEIKNKQIEDLSERLAESQRLLNQQQQLQAMAEQKMKLLEQGEESPLQEEKKSKWRFWKF